MLTFNDIVAEALAAIRKDGDLRVTFPQGTRLSRDIADLLHEGTCVVSETDKFALIAGFDAPLNRDLRVTFSLRDGFKSGDFATKIGRISEIRIVERAAV